MRTARIIANVLSACKVSSAVIARRVLISEATRATPISVITYSLFCLCTDERTLQPGTDHSDDSDLRTDGGSDLSNFGVDVPNAEQPIGNDSDLDYTFSRPQCRALTASGALLESDGPRRGH